jgi:hypothetical protein
LRAGAKEWRDSYHEGGEIVFVLLSLGSKVFEVKISIGMDLDGNNL